MRHSPATLSPVGAVAPRAPTSPLTQRSFSWKHSERKRHPVVIRSRIAALMVGRIVSGSLWDGSVKKVGRNQPGRPMLITPLFLLS